MAPEISTSLDKVETSQKEFKDFYRIKINYPNTTFLDSIYALNSAGVLSNDIKFYFRDYVDFLLKKTNSKSKEEDIIGVEGKNGKIYIYLKQGKKLEIKYSDLKEYIIKSKLGNVSLKQAEQKVEALQKAMEAIYSDNNGVLWNDEINDEDIVRDDLIEEYNLDPSLRGKNLKDLRRLLETESKKLEDIYRILGETKKKKELLKREIELFAGIGDKFEGGAGYLRMTTQELESMVRRLCSSMTIEEVFDYIRNLNKKISDNFKRSDMVKQVNGKLTKALYSYTFERLKREKAPNRILIEFIKIITGRGKLKDVYKSNHRGRNRKKVKYENRTKFDYETLDIADDLRDQMLANQVLIYIMYREDDPLINKIAKKQKIELSDKELEGKTPVGVIEEFEGFFDGLQNSFPNYGQKILKTIGYTKEEFNKDYSKLDFMQKVKIGALARLLKELKKLNKDGRGVSVESLNKLSQELTKEAFDDLNEALSDNFDATWTDWNGISAKDLGLSGEEAEIFELYQDINGNGLFDLEDENELGLGAVTLGLSLLAGVVIFGVAIPAVGAAATLGEALVIAAKAGALSGAVSSTITQLLSDKGYDDIEEALLDISSQFLIDVALSTIFTMVGLGILKGFNLPINPDLIFSKQAWTTKAGLIDKSFIVGEVGATAYVSSKVSDKIKQKYIKNHSDTDLEKTEPGALEAILRQLEEVSKELGSKKFDNK